MIHNLLLNTIAFTSEDGIIFQQYMANFNKSYSSLADFQFRFEMFKRSLDTIEELSKNTKTVFRLNQFSDWSNEEY